jgi:hypothetical protein
MRRLLPYTTIAMFLAIGYTAWTMLSRRQANRDVEHAAQQREAEADRKVLDRLGGGELKILSFYPSKGGFRRGEKVLVCFGVASAKEVRIDPEVGPIPPSLSRCLEVHPVHTTEYTLTARDQQGHTASQSFQLSLVP